MINKEKDQDQDIQRILVALDASPHSMAALELATELATKLNAELVGIFVEDINLLRVADLPFAQEIGYYSANLRQLDTPLVSLQLRTLARSAERALALVAERAQLRWSFRTVRGVIPTELLTAALETDLIILGKSGWSKRKGLGSTAQVVLVEAKRQALLLEPGVQLGRPAMVVYDGSKLGKKALSIALAMQIGDNPLTVLFLAETSEEAQIFQSEVHARSSEKGVRIEYHWMSELDQASLMNLASSRMCRMLILPAKTEYLANDKILTLLNNTDCGALLVR